MHAAGNGNKKNIKMAKRWFRLAIKRGDPAAKILLKRLDES
jgi:TPR repeat protein